MQDKTASEGRPPCIYPSRVDSVEEWLAALRLSVHVEAFSGVRVHELHSLTDERLRTLGIDLVGHRKRLLIGAKALHASTEADAETAAPNEIPAGGCAACAAACQTPAAVPTSCSCGATASPDADSSSPSPGASSSASPGKGTTPPLMRRRGSASGWRAGDRCPSISEEYYRSSDDEPEEQEPLQRRERREALVPARPPRRGVAEALEATITVRFGRCIVFGLVLLCAQLVVMSPYLKSTHAARIFLIVWGASTLAFFGAFFPTDVDLQAGLGRRCMMILTGTALLVLVYNDRQLWHLTALYPLSSQTILHRAKLTILPAHLLSTFLLAYSGRATWVLYRLLCFVPTLDILNLVGLHLLENDGLFRPPTHACYAFACQASESVMEAWKVSIGFTLSGWMLFRMTRPQIRNYLAWRTGAHRVVLQLGDIRDVREATPWL